MFDKNLKFVESFLFLLFNYDFHGTGIPGRYYPAGDPQGGNTAVPEIRAERVYDG
jgi:hypothetical protein